jgi:hypothetical protein
VETTAEPCPTSEPCVEQAESFIVEAARAIESELMEHLFGDGDECDGTVSNLFPHITEEEMNIDIHVATVLALGKVQMYVVGWLAQNLRCYRLEPTDPRLMMYRLRSRPRRTGNAAD